MLEKVQANRVLVLNVYRSVSREQVEQYLYKMLDPLLRMFVERENIPVQEEDKQFIIDFYKYALCGHGAGMDPPRYEDRARPSWPSGSTP